MSIVAIYRQPKYSCTAGHEWVLWSRQWCAVSHTLEGTTMQHLQLRTLITALLSTHVMLTPSFITDLYRYIQYWNVRGHWKTDVLTGHKSYLSKNGMATVIFSWDGVTSVSIMTCQWTSAYILGRFLFINICTPQWQLIMISWFS